MEILEGNKLIAEFMGWNKMPKDYKNEKGKTVSYGRSEDLYTLNLINYRTVSQFKYHSSWEALMFVVEKIEHKFTPIEIIDTQCRIGRTIYNHEEILTSSDNSKIEATWTAVVVFIVQYKESNLTNQ
jgi:hypothetical protein